MKTQAFCLLPRQILYCELPVAAGNFALRQKKHAKRSDRLGRGMIRSLRCAPFPAATQKLLSGAILWPFVLLLIFVCRMIQPCCIAEDLHRYTYEEIAMSIPVRIVVCSESESKAQVAAETAFRRVHELDAIMTDYDSDSELLQMCRQGGKTGEPATVSDDLFRVLQKSKQFSIDSGGAFDITVGPVVRLWRRARRLHEFPEKRLLDEAVALVGNDLWEIDAETQTVTIKKDKVLFDLGGIAKGDIIDQAIAVLKRHGIAAALVDAGGDIRVYGIPGDNNANGWLIGVSALGKEVGRVVSDDIAMASSGDLSRYVLIDEVRYSHIVDPKTGIGLTNQTAVTVFAPDATTADALATVLSVLPPEEGLKLLTKYEGTAAMISRQSLQDSQTTQNETEVWHSENWKPLFPVAE